MLKTLTFLNHYMETCTVVTRRNEALLGDFSCQVCVDVAIAAAIRARSDVSAQCGVTHTDNAPRRHAEAGIY
ncbi:hypothetical protein E1N52_35195 [Paraburkholderia guartelaensis]|uniref:Uncharacterized protein n=1 Tax=Paraburkholderia guartelaensis TaxID=2546446 RepID=A0A4R5L3V3_9BURK|nr:hypothetical protein [Paraburkholderia guartelaensis]TDG03361.1 hypothetical protein E1N52_35195 [Paraburkholderia guartelaensis]